MLILSYDIETTGLDKHKDRIIEVGMALYSTTQKRVLESTGFLVQSDGVSVSEEVVRITGITQGAVDRFGYNPNDALDSIVELMGQADIIATHNGNRFDLPFTSNTSKRLNRVLPPLLSVDTMTDIPGVEGEQLITMCARHGFLPESFHEALSDAKAVLRLLSLHDIDAVVERAKAPTVVILSHQGRKNNADAKKFKFRWNPDFKVWWKAVKEVDIEPLTKQAPFDISLADKVASQQLLQE